MKRMAMMGGGLILLAASAALAGQAQQTQPKNPPKASPRTGQSMPMRPAPRMPIPVSALLPNTQALFDGYVAANKMPGIVGAFGVGDGPTLFVTAGKIADEPTASAANADSLWRVYSMTKPITAMAAMILIEDGKLKLDEPLSTYIPAFKSMTVLDGPDSLASHPATHPITIRNLLTHTAGLGYSIITKGALLKAYEQQGILPAAVNAQMETQMRTVRPTTLEAFANRLATLPLVADPGTKWSYSIGLDLMGRVIEVASGMPFDAFVQARIFAPLKMTSSYWTVPASEVGRFATNYAFIGQNRVPLDPATSSVWLSPPSFPYGGAGLVMSARDYDRFLHMLQDGGSLDGVRVMKPETVALSMSNLLPAGVSYKTREGVVMGFGAGGSVALADVPGGESKGTYGWSGAAGTIGWVDPARHARGTVMVNYFPAEQWPLRTDVGAALLKDQARFKR